MSAVLPSWFTWLLVQCVNFLEGVCKMHKGLYNAAYVQIWLVVSWQENTEDLHLWNPSKQTSTRYQIKVVTMFSTFCFVIVFLGWWFVFCDVLMCVSAGRIVFLLRLSSDLLCAAFYIMCIIWSTPGCISRLLKCPTAFIDVNQWCLLEFVLICFNLDLI